VFTPWRIHDNVNNIKANVIVTLTVGIIAIPLTKSINLLNSIVVLIIQFPATVIILMVIMEGVHQMLLAQGSVHLVIIVLVVLSMALEPAIITLDQDLVVI